MDKLSTQNHKDTEPELILPPSSSTKQNQKMIRVLIAEDQYTCQQIWQSYLEPEPDLERYLTNNTSRIDDQSYLKAGLMIGSGVVESSNRRVVTQRLKQAGMHWSALGAEGVMALRAAYLSNSSRSPP